MFIYLYVGLFWTLVYLYCCYKEQEETTVLGVAIMIIAWPLPIGWILVDALRALLWRQ